MNIYQRFLDRTILVDAFTDSSVGYQPPSAAPNDDGIEFMSTITAADVIEVGLVVEHGPDPSEQEEEVWTTPMYTSNDNEPSGRSEALSEYIKNVYLPQYETRARFKLKSMTRNFSSDYELQVTDLKIPTGYDLEAV